MYQYYSVTDRSKKKGPESAFLVIIGLLHLQ